MSHQQELALSFPPISSQQSNAVKACDSDLAIARDKAEFFLAMYGRILQNAGVLFSWSDIKVESMLLDLPSGDSLTEVAVSMHSKLLDSKEVLLALINEHSKAEQLAVLVLRDYASENFDDAKGNQYWESMSVYRSIDEYVMEWTNDPCNAGKLAGDDSVFMTGLICQEVCRSINAQRVKQGMKAFWG